MKIVRLVFLSVFLSFSSYSFANQSDEIEFKYSNKELAEMDKWKNKFADDLWNDAMQCDRGALHLLGMAHLIGSMGLSIDVETANFCFERSASFGFAPAIKQVVHSCFEKEDPLLASVYCNLLVSFGHKEYCVVYHDMRERTLTLMGDGVCREIERMASEKYDLILNNIENLKKEKNKKGFFERMDVDGTDITSQDVLFNANYWLRFSKFQVEAEKLAARFDKVLQTEGQEFRNLYKASKVNVSQVIHLLKSNGDPYEKRVSYLKDANKAIQKTEELMILMNEFQNSSSANSNLKKLASEFFLLYQNAKGVLEQHRSLFMSPDHFLATDIGLEKLAEFTAGVDLHNENIEKIFHELFSANNS